MWIQWGQELSKTVWYNLWTSTNLKSLTGYHIPWLFEGQCAQGPCKVDIQRLWSSRWSQRAGRRCRNRRVWCCLDGQTEYLTAWHLYEWFSAVPSSRSGPSGWPRWSVPKWVQVCSRLNTRGRTEIQKYMCNVFEEFQLQIKCNNSNCILIFSFELQSNSVLTKITKQSILVRYCCQFVITVKFYVMKWSYVTKN